MASSATGVLHLYVVGVDELAVAVEQCPVGRLTPDEARRRPEHVQQTPLAVDVDGVPLRQHRSPVDRLAELVRRALVDAVQQNTRQTGRPARPPAHRRYQ